MSFKSELIQKLPFSPKFLLGLSLMSLPIAYIIKKHMDWKPNPDSKKRMLIHHLVFWSSCLPALKFLHKAWGEFYPGTLKLTKNGSLGKATGLLTGAVLSMMGGFEGGERLAKYLVPKAPKRLVVSAPNVSSVILYPSLPPQNFPLPYPTTNYLANRPMPLYSPFMGR